MWTGHRAKLSSGHPSPLRDLLRVLGMRPGTEGSLRVEFPKPALAPERLRVANEILDRYIQAVRHERVQASILRAAQSDYEEAAAIADRAGKEVIRLCHDLGIHPRGGPGTFSL